MSNKVNGDVSPENEETQNLWSSILTEVSTRSSSSTQTSVKKNIVILGDDACGKTTLVARLQGNEDPTKGAGLEYLYMDVHDEDRDEKTRCGVWILDGDTAHRSLLKFALNSETLDHSLVVMVVDMSRPWIIMEALQKWTKILTEHLESLNLDGDEKTRLQQKLVDHFQHYIEPDGSEESTSRRSSSMLIADDEQVLLPLDEGTLINNLGLPVVVVCTKSDAIVSLERDLDYKDEHLDFIQQHIRKFTLGYGASLFYVSVKENKNCDLLLKYLLHRTYKFPFYEPAQVVEKDAVFIPSGWDSLKKISLLYDNMSYMKPEDRYSEHISSLINNRTPVQDQKELKAEDEQIFLMKQQSVLSKNLQQPTGRTQQESPHRPSAGVARPQHSRQSSSGNQSGQYQGNRLDGPKGATNEGVLANFFNNLLNKKPGTPGAGPPSPGVGVVGGGKPAGGMDKSIHSDVAAELDRIGRKKTSTTPTTQNSGSAS